MDKDEAKDKDRDKDKDKDRDKDKDTIRSWQTMRSYLKKFTRNTHKYEFKKPEVQSTGSQEDLKPSQDMEDTEEGTLGQLLERLASLPKLAQRFGPFLKDSPPTA